MRETKGCAKSTALQRAIAQKTNLLTIGPWSAVLFAQPFILQTP